MGPKAVNPLGAFSLARQALQVLRARTARLQGAEGPKRQVLEARIIGAFCAEHSVRIQEFRLRGQKGQGEGVKECEKGALLLTKGVRKGESQGGPGAAG